MLYTIRRRPFACQAGLSAVAQVVTAGQRARACGSVQLVSAVLSPKVSLRPSLSLRVFDSRPGPVVRVSLRRLRPAAGTWVQVMHRARVISHRGRMGSECS
jgi:hypothetical protein